MQDINELIEELDTVYQLITSQATAHIHAKYNAFISLIFSNTYNTVLLLTFREIVMTYGHSTTIVEFLKAAVIQILVHPPLLAISSLSPSSHISLPEFSPQFSISIF